MVIRIARYLNNIQGTHITCIRIFMKQRQSNFCFFKKNIEDPIAEN